jgi:hypothetical protein
VVYVTNKLKKKDKNNKKKIAANEAEVGQVKVGMEKFMAQVEKVGLIACG